MMKTFLIDRQTLEDLNIPGKYRPQSLFAICNQVRTGGGERLLTNIFADPLTDRDEINKRSAIFQYFTKKGLTFPGNGKQWAVVENYLSFKAPSSAFMTHLQLLRVKASGSLLRGVRYTHLVEGITATISALRAVEDLHAHLLDIPRQELIGPLDLVLQSPQWRQIREYSDSMPDSVAAISFCHYFFCYAQRNALQELLQSMYWIDVYMAIGNLAAKKAWNYATAIAPDKTCCEIVDLVHPALTRCIANSVDFDEEKNLLFLTGANMAGKSTFMKSVGLAVFMAHLGFPVPAASMRFSVRDGLFTSINVSDDLSQGYSHFYAEVLRVKQVAEQVSNGLRLFVVFDELFKGTNVKDAYDATLAVTEAFGKYAGSLFIISSHILEVADSLRNNNKGNIAFGFMPTVIRNKLPYYTYRMSEGITEDRQGMMIIEREGIMSLLNKQTKELTQ